MSNWSYRKAPVYFPGATATKQGWINPATGEVLVAIANLNTKRTDANVVPTFTLAVPSNATYLTGQVLTFTVTPSEAVTVTGAPYIVVTIGAAVVNAVYDAATSTTTSLKFKYAVVAGNVDADGIAVQNRITLNEPTSGKTKGKVVDIVTGTSGEAVASASLTFTVPSTTGILVNGV